ncbi:DegT/DnrJ/EryC1/StrS family aminotransferase [Nocardia sp. NPDC057663]|uniref:DegT/DnrJ/EryC1/StrS family aminotransferase n=1 Tax=Nocardia sp. NPDC057663 TaxID=3346201 RepID=UPI00366E9957
MQGTEKVAVAPFRVDFTDSQIDQALAGFRKVLESGQLILGAYTSEFENMFADILGGQHAVSVNSGSTALEILFRSIGIAGRDVLVPTNTNFATAMSVVAAGGIPVFYDSGLAATLDAILSKISPRTAAVVVVHIGGHISAELPTIVEELRSRDIHLVEDAAHAHGSSLGGVNAGCFAHSAFSFFPTKVMTTFEGGMILTSDEVIAQLARQYRDQGKDASGELHVLAGNSWRLTEVGAVLGLVQLATFGDGLSRRNAIIARYREGLGDVLNFPAVAESDVLSGHKAVCLLSDGLDRDVLRRRAKEAGVVLAREVYRTPLHLQPIFRSYVPSGQSFPEADSFSRQHICLPLWTSMVEEDVSRVIAVVRSVLES